MKEIKILSFTKHYLRGYDKYLAGFSTKVRHELCEVLYRGMRKSWQVVIIKFLVVIQ